jgi:hypothetical protein
LAPHSQWQFHQATAYAFKLRGFLFCTDAISVRCSGLTGALHGQGLGLGLNRQWMMRMPADNAQNAP